MFDALKYNSLYTNGHGGNCCGVRHLFGFDEVDESLSLKNKKTLVAKYLNTLINEDMDGDSNRDQALCIEVVLAEFQWRKWEPVLRSFGFEKKFQFVNGNTANRCRMYFLATNQPSKKRKEKPLRPVASDNAPPDMILSTILFNPIRSA